ncbi:MAG: hypothetical protein K2J72_08710, partial [Oscillospiraceae bacterium]|nr:hypothetical protein [Oscillospiraceae bacterium]
MMLAIEERLFDEYKHVDKLCREIFSSQSGVTQYITEMERIASYGRSVIPSWNDDYYTLKRVRWLRNKIAHESGATECNWNDAAWLENFHRRLLARQDPLALLSQFNYERSNYPPRQESMPIYSEQMADRNARLRKKKSSPLRRTVVTLIVLIEVFIILT